MRTRTPLSWIVNSFGEQIMPGFRWLALLKTRLAERYVNSDNLDGAESLLIEAQTSLVGHSHHFELGVVTRVFGQMRFKQRRYGEVVELFQAASKLFRQCG